MAHHAKNNELLSDTYYKENYEQTKDIVYFPVDAAPTYQSTKRVKTATDDKNYKADYENMKKQNQLNLCETPVYKTQKEHQAKTSDANYKKDYEQTKINVHPAPVTHEMVQSKKQQEVLTKDAYTKEGMGAIRSHNIDAGMLNRGDIQQAMKTQKIDDHLKIEYKKDYEENKVKLNHYDKALVDVPLIKQNIKASKQADPTNTTCGESGRKAMERNEFTKTYCDTNVYKTNKAITNITRDSIYQKQRQEAIDQFKGFQQMDIMQVGSFKQHMANQENQSDNYYKEDYNLDKDLVYFPANVTDQYENQKKLHKVKQEYAKDAAKDAERHQFNLADTQTYKTANDVKMATTDREYTKKWQQQKIEVKPAAVTPQMELIKKNEVTKDSAYTEQWNKDKLKIHYPPDNPAMLNAKKAAKQSSDLHYKKDYNENVLGAKSHMTADGDLEYVVAKQVQDITGANYSKDAREKMGEHGFAPEFVQTEAYKINKNITEITSDRYKRGAKENAMKCKGYQNMDPAHNPTIQHHAKNADQLNPYLYKEDYEYEKHDFYFPQHATEGYVNQKKLQEKVGAKEYKEDYEKMKKKNVLNLAETEKYQLDHEVEKYRSDKKYKEKYAKDVQGHCIGFTTTPHMETIKQVKPYQNDSSYKKDAKEAMMKNLMDDKNPELELSKKRTEIRSDVYYQKDYRENVQGHNIPGPVENYHDYKAQADLKAKVSDKAYKEKYEEEKLNNSITKEYCNTEQYKAQQKVKECQSLANYTDFPETRDKYKGFQQLDITTIPSFMMHSRNADQLSEACYKEDWNIDKECVYFPVQVTEKYAEDKKLKKAMTDYQKAHNESKMDVNFNAAETEKYIQDKKTRFDTSDNLGYKKDYRENVQGTMKGTPVTMEMENLKKLEITKVGNYGTDAKERMKSYSRSLEDPDYQTQLKAQVQRSDKDYKKDYNENVLGHNIGAPVEGHLDYKAQMEVRAKTQDAAYKKDATENMRTFILEPNAPVLRNNIEIQKTVNQALYTKSGKDAIAQYKGFQQLDVFKNPYMNRHIINSENLSDAMYREGYEIDKDCIYYPYNTSEKYSADKKLHDTVGDIAYSAAHKEEDWKHKFDLCTSEKYLEDQKAANFKGKAYKAQHIADTEAGKGGGKLVHTWEIDAKNVLQPLRDRVYKQSASQLQRKYHLMMDDLKLEHLMKVQNVQNDRLYKAKYDAETKGTGAANPGIAYPHYAQQKAHTDKMRQSKYQEGAREAMKTVHFDIWEEQHRARAIALSAKDSEYRKSRDNAIATMKGFQTMDAAHHPDVVRGNRAADLASHWVYINDWEEEKDLVYYPVHESEKYIADKKNREVNYNYANQSKEIQSKVRFNLAETEKYAADKKHEMTRSDKHYQADYKAKSHIYKGTDETMQMVVNKSLVNYSGINYAKEAKALSAKYGLTADDNKLAASMLSGKITSDLLYKKHYEENVKGKPANNPGIAYEMSTEMAKRNNKQLSDSVYQSEGRKAMEHNEYTKQQYTEMVKARLIALQCNDAEYRKGKQQAVEEFKGYMKMDAASHPIVTRGIQVSELLSDALYKEDWEIEKDLIYYPVNVTPMYETMKNNKTFQSDLIYKANYEETKFVNKFNSADTQKYADDHKVREFQSEATYRKQWNETERHQFKTPAVTMEMERVSPLKKLTAGVYAREAKNLAMKYGLVYDDITLTNLMAVGSLASDIHYQKKYRAEDLGKSSTADVNGYLPYVSQKQVRDKTSDKNYKKDAVKVMEHNNYQLFDEEKKAQKIALSCKASEYKKSMLQAIDEFKGYMRMDAHLHPVVQRGVAVAEMQSQALYTEEWEIEKDAIYFPVQLTPGYETAMNAHKIQSDLHYKADHEANKFKNIYNAAATEKYVNDKKLSANIRSDKGYHAEHEKTKVNYTLIDKTSEMERASIQRDLRDANYSREAKNLAMKYGLTHDDLKLKTLMAVGGLASDKIYKKAYNKEMLGLKSTADVRGYLPYVTGKEVHEKTMDKNYQKEAKEANMHNKFVQWEEELRARKVALSVKDSAYKKSMWDAIEEYKGFMRMDAALHPVVQRGIHQAELVSDALYKEEWNIEKDLIYFPVQITPGYETAQNAQAIQSNIGYTAQHNETKMKNTFDACKTERYADIQKHEKARSDKTYKADFEANKHIYKGTPVTMDMERAKIQLDINEANYKKEAKKLAMKYGLTPDDTKLANCIAVAAATSDRLYRKHWAENVQGLSSKADVQGHPVYKDSAELKKKLGGNYTKAAKKILEKNNYAQFDEEVRARTVALYCNPDEYSKQRRECINEFKGYMRMDAALHPVVQRGILVAELQSEALYREDYEMEKDLIYFPAQVTPGYEAAQQAYKFASDIQYRKDYNQSKTEERPNQYNQCQTEKYVSDKNVDKARSDFHYKKDYNQMKSEGKAGGKGIAVTMEMERIKANEKIAVNLYNKEAKQLAMKYGLDAQDMTMQNLIGVQKLRSDLNYKKKYNETMLGLKSTADLKGYPHLEASNKLQKEMTIAEYSKDARKILSKNNYAKFDEQERAEKMAYSVRGSNYQRQGKECIEKFKGFQRMDAHQHPIIIEGERVNNIISHSKYIEDYLIDRNVIYYPVHLTPGYESAMFADKWQSNISYHKDHHETKMKNKFNMADTDRYKEIKTHESYRSDKAYKAKQMKEFSEGKGLTSIPETSEMVLSKILKPLRADYHKEAKQLATKYGLVHGAMEIAHAMEMSELTNASLYKKDWATNVQGTSAKNPAIAHPLHDLYKACQQNLNDRNYKKDLDKMHTYTVADSDEAIRARKTALMCTPKEYNKQRAEVVEKYKGFQRMDAASHPIVVEGERVNNLISKAKYLEDYLIERESCFFPVHMTEGYDVAIKSSKFQSEKNYKADYQETKFKNVYNTVDTEKYKEDLKTDKFRSDTSYKKAVKQMFAEGKGYTEVADRFDINLSKTLKDTRGENYTRQAKEICGKYGLAHDAMAITAAIAIGDQISTRLYKKKFETEVKGTGAKNPGIAHPEYIHYKEVQASLNQTNYKAEYEKTQHTYTAVESDEILRARKVALACTDKEYKKQRAEVIEKYKGFQHMDAHLHPVVAEGERVNDIISHSKYIEDYLMERNYIYFPAHITPGYETAVAVNKFQSDIPYRQDYLATRHKNTFNAVETEKYQQSKDFTKKFSDKNYVAKWHEQEKLKFTSIPDTPVIAQAIQNSKNVRSNDYGSDAKKILAKYGLEFQNMGLQHCIESAKHAKDYLYKDKYNKETLGKGAVYKGIDDVADYARAKVNQANLNDDKYRETGEKFNHIFTPVYDTPIQLTALQNQKNINSNLYAKSRVEAIEKYKGFQRMDAATHPIVIEGERVNNIISHQKYIEDYLIDRNVIYYPVHLTPGYEAQMYASKWTSNLHYNDDYNKTKVKHVFNATETEKYVEDKNRHAKISSNQYGKEWYDKLHNGKEHTQIADPTEVKLAKAVKPWIGKTAYTKAAQEVAARHGLVAGDLSLQHAAESQMQLSMKDYRKVWCDTVQGKGGNYKSVDDMFVEKQAKLNQTQLSQRVYKAKDAEILHKYTPVIDTPDMQRVKAQAGLLNDVAYSQSRRDCIDKFKGFQNMDAHSHPVVVRGTEASERISNAKYTEEWNEMKEMIYFPVQITPGYESAMQAYQNQSQLLYNKEYHRTKHANVFNHCTTENYDGIQKADKARSDFYYQQLYRENKGKGFTSVQTLKEKTASDVQKQTSMRDYHTAAKEVLGKYNIDSNAMQITHAAEVYKQASNKVYLKSYEEGVKGAPSKFFHLTETYDVYKKNAGLNNPKNYTADWDQNGHKFSSDDKSVAMEHAKSVLRLCSQHDYTKTQREVNKAFKAYSKLGSPTIIRF